MFDGLALGFVYSDQEHEAHGELTTFQLEGEVRVVFSWGERDARDEFSFAMVVASNDLDLQYPTRHAHENQARPVAKSSLVGQIP